MDIVGACLKTAEKSRAADKRNDNEEGVEFRPFNKQLATPEAVAALRRELLRGRVRRTRFPGERFLDASAG